VDNSGAVIIYSGGTWSDPVSIDSGSELTGVSCPSSTFCVAVDNGGNAFTYTGTAVDQTGNTYTYNGYSWNPPDDVDNGNEFTQVSCHSATFRVAVDNNGNAAVMTNGR
jgi:hypothetical protein